MNSEKMIDKIRFELALESVSEMAIEMMLLELYGDHDRHITTSWFYGPWQYNGK